MFGKRNLPPPYELTQDWSEVPSDELVNVVRRHHFSNYSSAVQGKIIEELRNRDVSGVDLAFLQRRWEATRTAEARVETARSGLSAAHDPATTRGSSALRAPTRAFLHDVSLTIRNHQ